MIKYIKIISCLFVLCSQIFLSGCIPVLIVGAAAGSAGVAYVMGDMEVIMEKNPEQIKNASEIAFKDLNILLISARATGIDGKVIGRTARDKRITITIKKESENLSKVSIRIGKLQGDQKLSHNIYESIKKHI
ncbi:MAG: DUF3568 family protein [Candidatus Scalinduaceae bacterium]